MVFIGGAGSFSKQESVFLFTWNSLLGAGKTVSKRFVFTVIKTSQVVAGTIDEILRLYIWSMNALHPPPTPNPIPHIRMRPASPVEDAQGPPAGRTTR